MSGIGIRAFTDAKIVKIFGMIKLFSRKNDYSFWGDRYKKDAKL